MTIELWAFIVACICLLVIVMPLGGYWLILRLASTMTGAREHATGYRDPVTVVIAEFNEETNIGRCLASLIESNSVYPIQRIIIADDGSTDDTVAIAKKYAQSTPEIEIVILEHGRRGKNATLGTAFTHVVTDVAVLTDADIMFSPDTIARLVDAMADISVGIVVGKTVRPHEHNEGGSAGEAVHQKVISRTAILESKISSTVLSNGHAYAVRRSLLGEYPNNAVADDFHLNLVAMQRGLRVLYASDACVQEIRHNSLLIEFNRTRRTIGSGIKTVLYSWSLLTSLHRPEAWFLLGHRVARWISPFALILALAALAVLASISTEASVILAVACAVIVAGGIGAMLEFQNISISILRFPAFFTMMNLAAAWAFVTVLAGGRFDQWRPSPEAGRQK